MDRSYDEERLIEKILDIYDCNLSDRNKYDKLKTLVDNDIETINIKKTKLEALIKSLRDEGLLITYELTTNITDEGHDNNGTLWIDLSVSIDDVFEFSKWLENALSKDNETSRILNNQNDVENFVRNYLKNHKVNFGEIGLNVNYYTVN